MGPLYKDATNPHFHSGYAALAQVYATALEPLAGNSITVIQLPNSHADDGGATCVDVVIWLALGDEYIESTHSIRPVKADPQGVGSAITYARRYALMAMVSLAPDDDDGNAAGQVNGTGPKGQPIPLPHRDLPRLKVTKQRYTENGLWTVCCP